MSSNHSIPEITSEQLEQKIKNEHVHIIDVREEDEYAAGHIPGSKLIPLSVFAERHEEIDRNQEAIIICRSGNRSGKACEFLRAQGYTNMRSLTGGMLGWQGEVEK